MVLRISHHQKRILDRVTLLSVCYEDAWGSLTWLTPKRAIRNSLRIRYCWANANRKAHLAVGFIWGWSCQFALNSYYVG